MIREPTFTAEQLLAEANKHGDHVADMLTYAATLRQQAARVDEEMVERAWLAYDEAVETCDAPELSEKLHVAMRAALEAALSAQPAQAVDALAVAAALESEYLAVANGEKKPGKLSLEPMVRAVQTIRALAGENAGWRDIATAPYGTPVLAWLFLPKNPPASAWVIAQRVYVEKDDGPEYPEHQRVTVGCWWANGRYYAAGHVTHWMPLPTPPTDGEE